MLPVLLLLEELEVAGRALEGGEATRPPAAALSPSAPVHRRECCRRADDATEDECAKTLPTLLAVHSLILRSVEFPT